MTTRDTTGPVLVTGANGFVGSHMVDELLRRGLGVRAAVRPGRRVEPRPAGGLEVVEVDYEDFDALSRIVDGCQGVVHVAGATTAVDDEAYEAANVRPTRSLAVAAVRAAPPPERFVLVSSLAAAGPSRRERPRDEDQPPRPITGYGRSKLRGERILRDVAGDRLPWSIVRPAAVYGPRDRAFLRLARAIARGWVPRLAARPQALSLVHALDLGRAIADVMATPAAEGRTYFVADPETTDADAVVDAMAAAMVRHPLRIPVAPGLVPVLARIATQASRLLRRPDLVPTDRLADLRAEAWTCSPARIAREVQFRPSVSLAEGLRETIGWYREQGWLAP